MVEAAEDSVAAVEVLVALTITLAAVALITAQAIPLLLLLDSTTMVHLQTAMVIPQLQPLDPHQSTVTELLLLPVAELCLGKNVTPSKTKFPDRNAAPFQDKNVTQFLTRSVTMFQDKNARVFQDRYQGRNVTKFQGKSVTLFQ